MTSLYRSRTKIENLSGGPGVATMYFLSAENLTESLQAYWNVMRELMPIQVAITVENTGDVIEDTTGDLVGAWGGTVQPTLPGLSNGPYPAPAGLCCVWKTTTILDSHRLAGRTFIVPVTSAFYQTDGTIIQSAIDGMTGACESLIAAESEDFVIWHRPFPGSPAVAASGTHAARPARAAHDGGHGLVTTGFAKDKVAILRSRRG